MMKTSISPALAQSTVKANANLAKSVIKKVLKVNCGDQNALHIGSAFFGYKNHNTLKALAELNFYSFVANLGSESNPMMITVDLGTFKTKEEAITQSQEIFQDCQLPKLEWQLYVNGKPYGYYTSYSRLFHKPCIYSISESEGYNFIINDTLITDEAADEVDYRVEDREELINNIYSYIPSASSSDRNLMKQDIELLNNLDDDYVLSSLSTNEYISESENYERFNELCSSLIEHSK